MDKYTKLYKKLVALEIKKHRGGGNKARKILLYLFDVKEK